MHFYGPVSLNDYMIKHVVARAKTIVQNCLECFSKLEAWNPEWRLAGSVSKIYSLFARMFLIYYLLFSLLHSWAVITVQLYISAYAPFELSLYRGLAKRCTVHQYVNDAKLNILQAFLRMLINRSKFLPLLPQCLSIHRLPLTALRHNQLQLRSGYHQLLCSNFLWWGCPEIIHCWTVSQTPEHYTNLLTDDDYHFCIWRWHYPSEAQYHLSLKQILELTFQYLS